MSQDTSEADGSPRAAPDGGSSPAPPRPGAYADLLNSLGGIVWEADGQTFQFTFVSPQAERILGYPVEQWLTEPDFRPRHTHPEDVARCSNFCLDTTRSGLDHQCEYRMIAADGRTVWLHDVVTVHREENQSPRLRGIMLDITERKAAEAGLRESRERLALAHQAGGVGTFDWHIPEDIPGWSAEMDVLYGLPPGGGSPEAWRRAVHPEDLHAAAVACRLAAGTGVIDAEWRVVWPDGSIHWLHTRGQATRDSTGRPVRMLGAVVDVTERKEAELARRRSEERYRSLVAASAQVVFTTDAQGNIVEDIPEWRELTGQTREAIQGRGWMDALEPEERRSVAAAWTDAIRNRVPFSSEYRLKDLEGRVRQFACRAVPVHDEKGVVREWVGTCTDVTERSRLQEQFLQAQKMEAVGRLAGGVAHDFNNMLAVISGFTELILAKTDAGDPRHSQLLEVWKAGERAQTLTRQLLLFSRKNVPRTQVLDLNHAVREMEGMLRRLIGEDILLSTLFSSGPLWVRADAGHLEQILMNLAVNARDAMPDGGNLFLETGTVVLDPERVERGVMGAPPGEYVMLGVTDTGVGMGPDELPHVFEPFFTTKSPGTGTGLGLATVYGIVEQAGGDLVVTSAPGWGTTFKVYLPPAAEPAPREAQETTTHIPGGSETLLVVEDETMVRDLVRSVLTDKGYAVLEASAGEEALRVCREHGGRIDLLLTDVVMPGMSGRALAGRVQELRPDTRVVYMSGYTDDTILLRGVSSNEAAFLSKPFTSAALARMVRDVLDEATPAVVSVAVSVSEGAGGSTSALRGPFPSTEEVPMATHDLKA